MLILLPPSEGKTAPSRGKPLALDALSSPELTAARTKVLDATIAAAADPDAAAIFKVSPGVLDEVRANADLRAAPTAPAAAVYSGVLYDALGYDSLDAASKRRAGQRIVVFSALLGALRMGDRIPAYRLAGGVKLPGIGALKTFWAGRLAAILDPLARRGLVIDCRSSTYAAMWPHPDAIGVRVFREANGTRSVVTHMAKHSRGLIARALCESPEKPKNISDLAALLRDHFAETEVRTATGAVVDIAIEHGESTIDVVTT